MPEITGQEDVPLPLSGGAALAANVHRSSGAEGLAEPADSLVRPVTKRWAEQRWILDNVIQANGVDWDQPRTHYWNAACRRRRTLPASGGACTNMQISPRNSPTWRRSGRSGRARPRQPANWSRPRESYFIAAIHWGAAQWPIDQADDLNRQYNENKILGAIAALSIFGAGVPEPESTEMAPGLSEQLRIASRPETIIVLTPFLIWSIANFGLYTFIAAVLGCQLPSTAIPVLLLLFGLGCLAGNFIGGALSDRYGARWPTIICLVMLICALATIEPASSSIPAASVTMIWWAICMAALFTLQQQRAIAANPKQSNLALALNNSALYLGASVGAAEGGVVISRVSLAVLAPTSAAAAALGLLAILILPRCRARATAGLPNDKIEPQSSVESTVPNHGATRLRDR